MPGEDNQEFPTIIGKDAKFKGELDFEKGVRVFGNFEGTVRTKGQLHVADGAKMKADVSAGNLDVDGEIKGNVTASGKVHLKTTARLEGDLKTARLEVADGATFIGNVVVGANAGGKEAAPKPAAQAPPAEASKQPADDQAQGKKG